ncbi:beta-ketoacyl synthase [Verrucomicrobia bacterium LW23]|nr:beta-ketoacyl synthase [Verrucomicrobia bacterium LW23]
MTTLPMPTTPATATESAETPTMHPVAIIGMGGLFPKALNIRDFWRNIRNGTDCITDIPASHWRASDYFDGDPSAPDKTYARRGGFLSPYPFDPLEFGIPPNVLEATDTSQLLGLVAARAALMDAGYASQPGAPGKAFDRDKCSVILGVTGALELVIPLGARLGHPLWRKSLQDEGVTQEQTDAVMRRIGEGMVAWQENSFPGLLGNVVAGRIANRLDLGGTNCVVDAACGSSLSATHLALLEIAAGKAEMVITGGVDTFNDIFMFMCFSKTPALSPSGDAKPFDITADGTSIGEGLGMVVLKRLDAAERDGDRIYAVIKGLGTASDGRFKSIYAPRSDGQAKALRAAYRQAGITPDTIDLLEAHGTGTKAGDLAEFNALKDVYREARAEGTWCAIGSVKSQIGHTKAAAGSAGLIKAALALYHKVLPPTAKITEPNPKMGMESSPFYLNTQARPWPAPAGHPRRAAVSAFGFGGSNFHTVLEEHAPAQRVAAQSDSTIGDSPFSREPAWDGSVEIAAFSAPSASALGELLRPLAEILDETEPDPVTLKPSTTAVSPARAARLSLFAWQSRQTFDVASPWRCIVVIRPTDGESLARQARALQGHCMSLASQAPDSKALPALESSLGIFTGTSHVPGKLALLFPGQGSQCTDMGRELATLFPEFQSSLDAANREVPGITSQIYPQPAYKEEDKKTRAALLTPTRVAQPALAAVCHGWLGVLRRFGVSFDAVAGHSFGELPALAAAGVLDEAGLMTAARARGHAMSLAAAAAGNGASTGAMLAVRAPLTELEQLIASKGLAVVLANRNSPRQGVLSGPSDAIAAAEAACAERQWTTRRLEVSAAFHSAQVSDAVGPFAAALGRLSFAKPTVPVYANTTAEPYPEAAARQTELLADQLAKPVRFAETLEALHKSGHAIFVEVGPKSVLTGLVRDTLGNEAVAIPLNPSGTKGCALTELAAALARLAALGVPVRLKEEWEPLGNSFAITPAKGRLIVPICGANYRSPQPERPPAPRPSSPTPTQKVAANGQSNTISVEKSVSPARAATPSATSTSTLLTRSAAPVVAPAEKSRLANGNGSATSSGPRATPPPARYPTSAMNAQPPGNDLPHPLTAQPPAPESLTLVRDAFSATQESLRALHTLSTQTAALHQKFLEGQDNAQRAFHHIFDQQRRIIERAMGIASSGDTAPPPYVAPPAPVVPVYAAPAVTPMPHGNGIASPITPASVSTYARSNGAHPTSPLPSYTPASPSTNGVYAASAAAAPADMPAPLRPQAPATPPTAAEPTTPKAATPTGASIDAARLEGVLLDVVADKTGYPRETLGLEMDFESDLGIDSIKRVEILAALREKMPEAPSVEPEHLGTLRNLRDIIAFITEKASPAASTPISTGTPVSAPAPKPAASASSNFAEILLDVVADKTGYPRETLGLEMDLESDLGIDSIKRVEILAGMRQRAPEAPSVEPEHLGSLRTLQDILNFLGERMNTGDSPPGHSSPPDTAIAATASGASRSFFEQASRPPAVERRELIATAIAPAPTATLRVAPDHEVLVAGGGGSRIGQALVEALRCSQISARLVDPASATHISSDSSSLRTGGLVIVAEPVGTAGTSLVSEASEQLIKQAFALLKKHNADIRSAARKGGAFVATVTCLNGKFGLGGPLIASAADGGLAGLAKTVASEWAGVRSIAFDVAAEDPATAAQIILQELAAERVVELGVATSADCEVELTQLQLVERPFPRPEVESRWGSNDVIVVTGGARGVTAASALGLAEHFAAHGLKPTVVLMGRSAAPKPEPAWLNKIEGEAAIKRAVLENGKAEGKPLSPKAIGDAYRLIASNREVSATLERLNSLVRGAYVQADVRDKASMQAALHQVRTQFGPITGIVHGAGLLEDKRIEDKTTAQFDTVFDTKVHGLRHLLQAVSKDPLKAIAYFSSVSGRFGRRGQIDYSIANEVLNKVAQAQALALSACRVVSLNWGPWEGGMVTPGLRREFEKEGVGLIPLQEGARAFVAEFLAVPGVGAVEVTLGSVLAEPESTSQATATSEGPVMAAPAVVASHKISAAAIPVLRAHQLAGRSVVPLALMMEWFAEAAASRGTGTLNGLERVQVLKGLTLEKNGVLEARIIAGSLVVDKDTLLPLELVSSQDGRVHARATAIYTASGSSTVTGTRVVPPQVPQPQLSDLLPYRLTAARAYRDILFHGPELQAITHIGGWSKEGMIATANVAPAPSEWIAGRTTPWHTDPLVIDAAFQLAILWCQEALGSPSLPSRLGSYRQFAPFPPNGTVDILFHVRKSNAHMALGDFYVTRDGRVIASIHEFECTVNAALTEAFKGGATRDTAASKAHGGNHLSTSPVLRAPLAGE